MAAFTSEPHTTENWLDVRERVDGSTCALMCERGRWTFAELAREARHRASRLAALLNLTERAPSKPLRIAILSGNCPEFIFWLVAALQLGIEVVPLNTRLAAPELDNQLRDCSPDLLLHDGARSPLTDSLKTTDPTRCLSFDEALLAKDPAQPTLASLIMPRFDMGRIATIMYTSGSTGAPKGVLQSYGNHWHSAQMCQHNLQFLPNDIWGCPTPLFHTSGLSIVMRSLICGVGVRLYEHFDASLLNDEALNGTVTCVSAVTYQIERMIENLSTKPIRRYPPTLGFVLQGGGLNDEALNGTVTCVSAVTYQIERMIENLSTKPIRRYPPTLGFVLQGGGPLPLSTLEQAYSACMPIVQSFGMTETASQVVALSPANARSKIGSSGRALAGVQLRIGLPRDDGFMDVPPGASGHILLKSPSLAVGYLGQPQRYADSFVDNGWFDTKDYGHLDADGYLYVECRLSDLIVSGGENVYPAEVEAVLAAHPHIREAAVVGTPDPLWGSVPIAVCVYDGPEDCIPTDAEINAFVLAAHPHIREAAVVGTPDPLWGSVPIAVCVYDGPEDCIPTDAEINAFCRRELAAYKCPRRIVWTDSLPYTASGKLRRSMVLESVWATPSPQD